jgi:hypothetical protein
MNKSNKLTKADKEELIIAKALLENPGIAIKLTNLIGKPIEKGFDMLPFGWRDKIGSVTTKTMFKIAEGTLLTMKDVPKENTSNVWHKLGVAASGGVGGFFGIPALVIELPISTSIMLRSITDIARSQGEEINTTESKLACLEVFAFGGETKSDDGLDGNIQRRFACVNEIYSKHRSKIWSSNRGKSSRTSNAYNWSCWRCFNKYNVYRPFSRYGKRTFYNKKTGKKI